MTIITVKTGGIAADAVTDAKIADDVVGTEHLTANEVDTAALKGDAVTGAELADNAVNSEHYTDGSIDTVHLADGQVTIGKLATAVLTGATDIGAAIVDADLLLIDDGAGGTLRKTAASRLKTYAGGLAGVSTSSGNVTITDGNLTFGGAGHGVHLGVTSATAANLLDDYEEGTFTPNDQSGASLNFSPEGQYTKVGSIVHFSVNINVPSTSSSAGIIIGGLPFTVGDAQSTDYYGAYVTGTNTNVAFLLLCSRNSTRIAPRTLTNGEIANSAFSGKFFNFSGYYSIL